MNMEDRATLKRNYKQSLRPAGVIQIKNLTNGKIYICSSTNVEGMINRNKFQLKMGCHPGRELQQDYNAYGADNLSYEVLEYLEPEENGEYSTYKLEKLEAKWCETLQPYGERGYNRV